MIGYAFYNSRIEADRVIIIFEKSINSSIQKEFEKEFKKKMIFSLEKKSFMIFTKYKKYYLKKLKFYKASIEILIKERDLKKILEKISKQELRIEAA